MENWKVQRSVLDRLLEACGFKELVTTYMHEQVRSFHNKCYKNDDVDGLWDRVAKLLVEKLEGTDGSGGIREYYNQGVNEGKVSNTTDLDFTLLKRAPSWARKPGCYGSYETESLGKQVVPRGPRAPFSGLPSRKGKGFPEGAVNVAEDAHDADVPQQDYEADIHFFHTQGCRVMVLTAGRKRLSEMIYETEVKAIPRRGESCPYHLALLMANTERRLTKEQALAINHCVGMCISEWNPLARASLIGFDAIQERAEMPSSEERKQVYLNQLSQIKTLYKNSQGQVAVVMENEEGEYSVMVLNEL